MFLLSQVTNAKLSFFLLYVSSVVDQSISPHQNIDNKAEPTSVNIWESCICRLICKGTVTAYITITNTTIKSYILLTSRRTIKVEEPSPPQRIIINYDGISPNHESQTVGDSATALVRRYVISAKQLTRFNQTDKPNQPITFCVC